MYPQHQGASTSSYQRISPWDTRKKLVAMVEEVREGERLSLIHISEPTRPY